MLSRPLIWLLGVVLWFAVLFFLSSRPMPHMPGPEIPHLDKIMHASYFAIGSTMVYVGVRLRRPDRPWWHASLLALAFAALVGISDEFHQNSVPGRSGNDPYDWMADVLGGFLASGMGALVYGWVAAKTLVGAKISR